MSLRDYFSGPAAQQLVSISYNPDAKYAFVNFSSETARFSAIQLAASELFEGRRLDCRIRQDATSRSTKVNYGLNQPGKGSIAIARESFNDPLQDAEQISHFPEADRSQHGKEKYFIIKSGSLDALSRSLESGQWFVPNRHVKRLNHAFQVSVKGRCSKGCWILLTGRLCISQTASKVYFVFSVNGSRRFFGYALMKSEIQLSAQTSFQSNNVHMPQSQPRLSTAGLVSPSQVELTRAPSQGSRSRTHSLASSDSSAGSIYYEPERRRIIWEAPHHDLDRQPAYTEDQEQSLEVRKPSNPPARAVGQALPGLRVHGLVSDEATQSPTLSPPFSPFSPFAPTERSPSVPRSTIIPFSSPCQIKWLSIQNVSFDVLRGLKNKWNSNKEVFVARNVTAIEPSAGAMLVELFGSSENTSAVYGSGL